MNKFLRYLGIILVLLGVLVLALYYFGMQSNFMLGTAGFLFVAGIVAYIVTNKMFMEDKQDHLK